MVLKDFKGVTPKRNINPRCIQEGLEALERRNEIIIRLADKGGGVVILAKNFYHSQLLVMLAHSETYALLDRDPTNGYIRELNTLVEYGYYTRVLYD